jgi:hypothetical protein
LPQDFLDTFGKQEEPISVRLAGVFDQQYFHIHKVPELEPFATSANATETFVIHPLEGFNFRSINMS